MKILSRDEVAAELGKWGPGLRLYCDECGGKGMEALVEFEFKGQYHHHVCHLCLTKAKSHLEIRFQAIGIAQEALVSGDTP